MSGLTGYLLSDGRDLSSVFLTNGGATFTSAITTNAGIIGPSSSLTYSSGMIGYTAVAPADKASVSLVSGTLTSLMTNPFTMPTGVYVVVAYVLNTYSGSGSMNFINIHVSTSPTTQSGGFAMSGFGSASLPSNGNISGVITNIIQNTGPTLYYLAENVNYASITSVASSSTASNSYVKYTRVG